MTEQQQRAKEMFDEMYDALYMLTHTRADTAKVCTQIEVKRIIESWMEDGSNADQFIIEWWEIVLEELEQIVKI